MVVGMERVDATEAIPPVVARIFSGDSTAPLTREARIYCFSKYSAVLEGLDGEGGLHDCLFLLV